MFCQIIMTFVVNNIEGKITECWLVNEESIVQRRKWSPTANDPQTGNDPQIGPQMIPNRKWSPMWTANDPPRKITNGLDLGFLDFFKFCSSFFIYFFFFFIN